MKSVKIILSPEAEEVYKFLITESQNSKTETSILNAFKKKIELVKLNPHYGDPIAKRLIPKEYSEKYDVTNLFRVELPSYWRMLYTLTNNDSEVNIIGFVLDIIDHKEYNKKFGYKNK
jgi:predicted phosphoadenosine phosphosulfate sulfurtransferase